MALFKEFHNRSLPLFHLNYGIITLLRKNKDAISSNLLAKCELQNFYKGSGQKAYLISQSQTAFIPGRNIMEGAIILHETIHELHRKKMNGVILKLDFKKAHDKVKWSFLQQTLRMKGFSEKWCLWISQFVTKGSVGIKVNDDAGRYF
jgi:hypothetical protein